MDESKSIAPAFRIGGYYRDGCGDVCRIDSDAGDGMVRVSFLQGTWRQYGCHFRLSDGRYEVALDDPSGDLHLLPGELDHINGEWVPSPVSMTESEKTKTTMADILADALKLLDLPRPAKVIDSSTTRYPLPTKAAGAPTEPKRAPLPHYGQQTRYEAFPGFVVTSSTDPQDKAPRSFGVFRSPDQL